MFIYICDNIIHLYHTYKLFTATYMQGVYIHTQINAGNGKECVVVVVVVF